MERNRAQIKNNDCVVGFWNSVLQKDGDAAMARHSEPVESMAAAWRAAAEWNYEYFYVSPRSGRAGTPARPGSTRLTRDWHLPHYIWRSSDTPKKS